MIASPWLEIPLADYEGHMALPEIAQARMLADELESAVRVQARSRSLSAPRPMVLSV